MDERTDQEEHDESRMNRRRALTALGGAGLGAAGVVAASRAAAWATANPLPGSPRRPARLPAAATSSRATT